jgi:hypothetical protein
MSGCYTDFVLTRYEWAPNDNPTGVVVGFTAKCSPNGRSQYFDTVVASSSASGKTDSQVAALAYGVLSGSMITWADKEMHESALIGTVYQTVSGSS